MDNIASYLLDGPVDSAKYRTMPKKKAEKKDASKKAPAKKEKTQAKAKTTSKKADSKESKGRLVVSQHEKDEIDAVIDAFWLFIDLLKKAPRHLMIIGLITALIVASFSGWAQELVGQEKAGYWYAFTESDDELNRDLSGMYPNYSPDDSIKIEGTISDIEYFGALDDCSTVSLSEPELCEKYPVIHEDLGIIETDYFTKLQLQTTDYLFPSNIGS